MKRRELEELWLVKLREAHCRYRLAAAQHRRLADELASMPASDGAFAVAKARRAEAWALVEYKRVMGLYAKLVVDGEVPYDSE